MRQGTVVAVRALPNLEASLEFTSTGLETEDTLGSACARQRLFWNALEL